MEDKREERRRGQHIDSVAAVAVRWSNEWIKTDNKSSKLLQWDINCPK